LEALSRQPIVAEWLAHGARLDRHELVAYALSHLHDEPGNA
jgi:hypothetical protein